MVIYIFRHGGERFFSSVLFEMIKSNPFNREQLRMKFSESEEDLGKENQKTTQHEKKEVVSNRNSKVKIYNFDNFECMYGKTKKIALVESDIFC